MFIKSECWINIIYYIICKFNKDVGYAVFSDPSGLPDSFLEFDSNGNKYYGLLDGENLERYKMGVSGQASVDKIVEYYEKRIPEKIESVQYLQLLQINFFWNYIYSYY